MSEPDVESVFIFENGNVAVTDYNGDQIPSLQGRWHKKFEEIIEAMDSSTVIHDERAWRKDY